MAWRETRTTVVVRLLGREALAGRLGVEPKPVGPGVLGGEGLLHLPRPDAAGSPELGYFFKEVVAHVEEEAETGSEIVDVQAALPGMADIFKSVGQGERQLLHGVGPRSRMWYPLMLMGFHWGTRRAPNSIVSTTSRIEGPGGKMYLVLGDVLF